MRPALIVSGLLLAVAGSAQARQQFDGHRNAPVVRMVARNTVVPQRTQSALQLSRFALDADLTHRVPPQGWDRQDEAHTLWRSASRAVDQGEYLRASNIFHTIHENYPKSTYAPESWYWEAFSLYRSESGSRSSNRRRAIAHLDQQQLLYPRTPTAADGLVLATRLRGELAKAGDADARRELAVLLESNNECSRSGGSVNVSVKVEALSAFRQINPTMTVQYLRNLFERTASCTNSLRQQSVFILAQVQSPEASDILLNLAANSRDPDVRIEAVQWIADLRDDRAIGVLRDILLGQSSERLKKTALFSLTQLASAGDAVIFRSIAASRSIPVDLRVQAVLWLSEQRLQDHTDWIRGLYRSERSPAIREAVVNAIAGQRNLTDREWLMTVGSDTTASLALRKQAITAAGELLAPPEELYTLYNRVELVPLREQIIDLLGRNREKSAVDRLIDIATQDADSTMRTSSVKWLRQSKDPKAVEFLIAYRER